MELENRFIYSKEDKIVFEKECCYYSKRTREIEPCKLKVTVEITCENKKDEKEIDEFYTTSKIFTTYGPNGGECSKDIKDYIDTYTGEVLEEFFSRAAEFGDGIYYFSKEDVFKFPNGSYLPKKKSNIPHALTGIPAEFFFKHREQVDKFQHLVDKNSMIPYLDKLPWNFKSIHLDVIKKPHDIDPKFIYMVSDYSDFNIKEILVKDINLISKELYEILVLKDIIRKLNVSDPKYENVYSELNSRLLSITPVLEKISSYEHMKERKCRSKLLNLYYLYSDFMNE